MRWHQRTIPIYYEFMGATETKMKTVLITGAAGNIGGQLRRQFAGKYKLRLSDKRLLTPSAGETFVQADIVDMVAALAISEGADAIVHLGGYAAEGPWETILTANIIGCYNVFEAARRNGVTRLVSRAAITLSVSTNVIRRSITASNRNLILATAFLRVWRDAGEPLR